MPRETHLQHSSNIDCFILVALALQHNTQCITDPTELPTTNCCSFTSSLQRPATTLHERQRHRAAKGYF